MTLRVLHVIDSLAGSGGAENRLVDEVLALDDRFDQVVVRLFERDGLQDRLAAAGIGVEALGFTAARAGRSWPLAAARLHRALGRHRPDVVHTSLFTGNLVGQLAAAPRGVPVVSTFNRTGELALQRQLQAGVASWKGRAMQAVGRWAARRGDVHHRAVGGYALETNCASMGLSTEAATVVPRGVTIAPEEVAGTGRVRFGLPGDGPLFVNVARRVPEKAQHLLVEAFGRVRADLPGAVLAIAGPPGPADPDVRAAISRLDLEGAVHLLGHRDDARALVAAADVFAFSSLSEGSPGAVVEALALGTPVAAFDIPPVAELTEGDRYAWLAEAGSAEQLAKAMMAALDDPERARRVAAARERAEQYRLPAVAAALGDLLEARARGRGRTRGESRGGVGP